MSTILKRTIRGKTIELAEDSGFAEGQQVTVTVQPANSPTSAEAWQALRDAAGGWAEDGEELDRYLEWNRQQRKIGRREIPE